jgi:hypothetical protein
MSNLLVPRTELPIINYVCDRRFVHWKHGACESPAPFGVFAAIGF